jgi:hypothetical protein
MLSLSHGGDALPSLTYVEAEILRHLAKENPRREFTMFALLLRLSIPGDLRTQLLVCVLAAAEICYRHRGDISRAEFSSAHSARRCGVAGYRYHKGEKSGTARRPDGQGMAKKA